MKRIRKWLFGVLAFSFIVLLGFFIFSSAKPPPPTPLPTPNGYNTFVKAGEMITGDPIYNYSDWDLAQLRGFVASNSASLQLCRVGLTQDSRVPIMNSEADMQNRAIELPAIKRMSQAFCAEGRLAELKGQPVEAAESYLDCIRLGSKSGRGGLMIDRLVGSACEGIGATKLEQLAPKLEAQQIRDITQVLESLLSQRVPVFEFVKNDKAWASHTFRLGDRLRDMVASESLNPSKQECEKFIKDESTRSLKTLKVLVDLAARAYELEKGKRPKALADLVPDYLKAIPQDPLIGTNMVWNP